MIRADEKKTTKQNKTTTEDNIFLVKSGVCCKRLTCKSSWVI